MAEKYLANISHMTPGSVLLAGPLSSLQPPVVVRTAPKKLSPCRIMLGMPCRPTWSRQLNDNPILQLFISAYKKARLYLPGLAEQRTICWLKRSRWVAGVDAAPYAPKMVLLHLPNTIPLPAWPFTTGNLQSTW